MRVSRVEKFRKQRYEGYRKFIISVVILPFACIFLGYLITSLFILPIISK